MVALYNRETITRFFRLKAEATPRFSWLPILVASDSRGFRLQAED
jgi:hypothetical protein